MVHVTPRQLLEITGARHACGPLDRPATGVAIDSRAVQAENLFVALPGERVDGNDYACGALDAGAAVVVMTREPDAAVLDAADRAGAAVLVSSDAQAFLDALAGWWRSRLDCVVVGVTGSSGKTTTKEMVGSVLASRYRTHITAGNRNSLIGAPLTILSCPLDAQALVVEMGMDHAGEIAAIARVARPDYGIVTNVGTAHIGILGSREGIAAAKAELVAALPPTCAGDRWPSRALLWGEDDFTPWIEREVAGPCGVEVLRFGTSEGDDARCTSWSFDGSGCASGVAVLPSGASMAFCLSIPGAHNVVDALAAAAVGDLLGVAPAAIAEALEAVRPVGMHQSLLKAPGGVTVLDDSYNANPDSMRRAVDALCALPADRRVACLGDMGDLGERCEGLHALVGAYVAAKPVDVLVAVGPSSRAMAEAARLMGMAPCAVYEAGDADEAGELLRGLLAAGDAVLVKASRTTGLDRTVKAVMGA